MNDSSLTPPSGSPHREAVDSLRGYSYQMLRSIETWLDLRESEELALEGAEDLDRIGPHGATVEQVKDTAGSGNVTLRSQSVLEAIGNFWEHLERNPGTQLRFRFLTTAGVGRERNRPLGLDDPGLELWRRIQAAPASTDSLRWASAIQSFLKDQEDLPGALRDWLGPATPKEFVSRIVLPIEWVTGWPDWQGLKSKVEAKLIELCEGRGIGSADALAALDALHSEVWRVATSKGARLLRRGDLLRLVDAAGTTAVPNAQLLAMMRSLTGGATAATAVAVFPEPFGLPPQPAPRRHARPELERLIADALDAGTVLIYGATGMGKTGLALAVTRSARSVVWVDLRDVQPSAAATRIDAVWSKLSQIGGTHDVVLDDLPTGGDARVMENALGRLRSFQDGLGGRLLVTSADRLPPRTARQLLLEPAHVFPAPAFSPKDIEAFLVAVGCHRESAGDWSKIINASTSGHPQLVDARVAALAEASFPRPDLSELLVTPPEIVDARAEARRIVATRPAEDRELLARASLLLGRVPRGRLMAVAQVDPPISEPGDVIDRLTGPWLERTGSDDLRASPLLRNLGKDTRGEGWSVSMHRGIAFTFLKDRSLLASDILGLATHAMLGRTAAPLIRLLPSLLQASSEVWTQIAETASVLVYVGVGEGMTSPFPLEVDTAAFRVLQLRIAIEAGKQEQITSVLKQALREFDARPPDHEVGSDLFEVVLLWQLLQKSGDLPLADGLRLGLRFAKVGRRVAEASRDIVLPDGSQGTDAEWPDLSAFIPMMLMPTLTDVDGLTRLLDLVEELDPNDRALALGGFAVDREAAALALDRVWLGEASRPEPRWPALAATLERTMTMAGTLDVPNLADAAAPLLVRVTDENLRDAEAALARADALIANMGRSPRVLAAKARVLVRRSRAPEALSLYKEALSAFPLGLSWRTDALRDAGVAAGRADEWELAAERLDEALRSLEEAEPPVRRIGLLFDHAIALHLSGRTREAVDCLGSATDLLVEDGRALPPEPLVSVRQFGSQVVKTITADLRPGTMSKADAMDLRRVFGAASAMEELTWGDQAPAHLDLFLLIMAELDLLLPEPPAIATRLAGRLRASSDLVVQCGQGDLLTWLAVRTLDMTAGAADAVREACALAFGVAERNAGREVLGRQLEEAPAALPAGSEGLVKLRLLARAVPLLATGRHRVVPIERWRSDLPTGGSAAEVHAMLDDLDRMIAGTENAVPRILNGNATWEGHLLAALMAPIQRQVTAGQLLVCHAVAARYLDQPKLSEFVEQSFSAMVTDAWLERCDSPAFLVAPSLSVPAITGAATGMPAGRQRVVAILSAAMGAVSAQVAASVRELVRQLER